MSMNKEVRIPLDETEPERAIKPMVVIKLIEAPELPALCAGCNDFMDDLCVEFPAAYDLVLAGYLCDECAQAKAPAVSAMLSLIMAGALFAYLEATDSSEVSEQLEHVKSRCLGVHSNHFAGVYGKPEPDYYLTSQAEQ